MSLDLHTAVSQNGASTSRFSKPQIVRKAWWIVGTAWTITTLVLTIGFIAVGNGNW